VASQLNRGGKALRQLERVSDARNRHEKLSLGDGGKLGIGAVCGLAKGTTAVSTRVVMMLM